MRRVLGATAAASAASLAAAQYDPQEVAARAFNKYISVGAGGNGDAFGAYSYGPAVVVEAAYVASREFKGQNYSSAFDPRLDNFLTNATQPGYKILHDIAMPFDAAVGDGLGLFPIAFLARMDFYGRGTGSDEWKVATGTAQRYIDAWPYHLPDGTYSRMSGWPGEPTGKPTFVWADDSFMGLALLARLVEHDYSNATAYIDIAASIQTNYAAHLRDKDTGLFRHGYNDGTGHQSCCSWGRANGWLMMSHVEALRIIPKTSPLFAPALAVFQDHAASLLQVQDASDGRWHQVLDHPETYLETSSTAMNLFAMATGVINGWLDQATYDAAIRTAWKGVAGQVAADGTVNGICVGTGVLTSVAAYNARPTTYLQASPGLGAVFRSALAYNAYISQFGA